MYVHVPILHKEYNLYAMQTYTNKKTGKKYWHIKEQTIYESTPKIYAMWRLS